MSQDRVWDRVRQVGLDELLQFDWTMVGESDALDSDHEGAGWKCEMMGHGFVRSRYMADRQRTSVLIQSARTTVPAPTLTLTGPVAPQTARWNRRDRTGARTAVMPI